MTVLVTAPASRAEHVFSEARNLLLMTWNVEKEPAIILAIPPGHARTILLPGAADQEWPGAAALLQGSNAAQP